MELTDAQIRAIGDRIQRDQAAAMQRQVQGWVRDYLGAPGLPPGQYSTFVWDGRRVVGGQGAVGTFADRGAATSNIANETPVAYEFDRDSAGWWSSGDPTRITVPARGEFLILTRPYWVTDNTTGDRRLEIIQYRDSVSPGYEWGSKEWAWPSLKTTRFLATYPTLAWITDVEAGDYFIFTNEHNGGVGTLKCRLEVWMYQIGAAMPL